MRLILFCLLPIIFFFSCSLSHKISRISYTFEIKVLNRQNEPIKNAKISYYINEGVRNSRDFKKRKDTVYTDQGGKFNCSTTGSEYGMTFHYEIEKEGYCLAKGRITKSRENKGEMLDKIFLIREGASYFRFNTKVKGIRNNRIANCNVAIKLSSNKQDTLVMEGKTNIRGILRDSIMVPCINPRAHYKLLIEVTKEGYYPQDTTITLKGKREPYATMNLFARTDYVDPFLLENKSATALVLNVMDFIDLIILRNLLSDYKLKYNCANLQNFKNANYITFKFDNKVVYNSLQLSKYDIAERLFDEVILRILNPLNDKLGKSELIFGYGLKIKTAAKSFTDDDSVAESLFYDFYLPQEVVSSYINLDITGQQLLDYSIILLDGERIGLRLQ